MNMGIGAMLYSLIGGSKKDPSDYYGRMIIDAEIHSDQFLLHFEDGVTIKIWDSAQSCCEHRYMSTDDNPKDLVGKKLKHIIMKECNTKETEYGDDHETVFVEIMTECGETLTIVNHNEHNGYYGGFGLSVDEVGK